MGLLDRLFGRVGQPLPTRATMYLLQTHGE
jgi:hypothetical protein